MVHIILDVISIVFTLIFIVYIHISEKLHVESKKLLDELLEINDSLKKEIKFQSNVNKTLREGLDAITKKNCHVKNEKTNE